MKVSLVVKVCRFCKQNFVYALAPSVLRLAFQVLMFKTFITRGTFITPSPTL